KMRAGEEASMDGQIVFEGPAGAGGECGRAGGDVAASGGGSLWGRDQDGDRLGSPVPADGAAGGAAAGWPAAEEAGRRVSRVAARALSGGRLCTAWAGWHAGSPGARG